MWLSASGNELTREYATKNEMIGAYISLAKKLIKEFRMAYIERFPRTRNSHANALATLASAVDSSLKRTIEVKYLLKSSIETMGQSTICDIEANIGIS